MGEGLSVPWLIFQRDFLGIKMDFSVVCKGEEEVITRASCF